MQDSQLYPTNDLRSTNYLLNDERLCNFFPVCVQYSWRLNDFYVFTYLFIIQTNKQTPSPPKQKTNKNTPNRQFFDPSDIWIEAPLKYGFQQQLKYFFF